MYSCLGLLLCSSLQACFCSSIVLFFYYFSSAIQLEIWDSDPSSIALFAQCYFGCLETFGSYMKFMVNVKNALGILIGM